MSIPKAVLVALGVLAVAGIGVAIFLLGRSTGSSDESPASGGESQSAESLECSRQEFERASAGTELEDEALRIYTPPGDLIDKPEGFGISVFECADLTGDDVDEMIGALAYGASYRTTIYGIYTPGATDWELAFVRSGFVISDLDVRQRAVIEEVPTYGIDDALCCPSGFRENRVAIKDGDYRVSIGGASNDRGIAVSEQNGVTELGPIEVLGGGPSQATAAFGAPTSAFGEVDEVISLECEFTWADLGLRVSFVNLGGGDACSDGLIQSFEVVGRPAELAGWQTADGVHVGMSQRALSKLYRGVEGAPSSGKVDLIQRYSEIGRAHYQDLLSAKLQDGEVAALTSFVGAAGD